MPLEDNQFYGRALVLYTMVSLTLKYIQRITIDILHTTPINYYLFD